MKNWFDKLPFRRQMLDQTRIAPGLTVRITDHDTKPVTFRFFTGEDTAQYSLTHNEAMRLASMLNAFLKKGPNT